MVSLNVSGVTTGVDRHLDDVFDIGLGGLWPSVHSDIRSTPLPEICRIPSFGCISPERFDTGSLRQG